MKAVPKTFPKNKPAPKTEPADDRPKFFDEDQLLILSRELLNLDILFNSIIMAIDLRKPTVDSEDKNLELISETVKLAQNARDSICKLYTEAYGETVVNAVSY